MYKRQDHTLTRHDHAEDPATVTLLDESDETYLQAAATTAEDLQVLAPRVSHNVREDVEEMYIRDRWMITTALTLVLIVGLAVDLSGRVYACLLYTSRCV